MSHHVTLLPGQKGTRKLQRQYGDALVRVRYRYDGERRRRLTTVELIIEDVPWEPRRHHVAPEPVTNADPPPDLSHDAEPAVRPRPWGPHVKGKLAVKLLYREADLRREVRHRGGWWDPELKVWWLAEQHVEALRLTHRIFNTEAGNDD